MRSLKVAAREEGYSDAEIVFARQFQLTPRQAAWLVLRRSENLSSEEKDLLVRLRSSCPLFEETFGLTGEFLTMLRSRKSEGFDLWLNRAKRVDSPAFVRFVNGLVSDIDAVRAALSLPWSNGQVEGQVNRLKMLKRQMYGRASFSLLSRRVLLSD